MPDDISVNVMGILAKIQYDVVKYWSTKINPLFKHEPITANCSF